jgi:hypothetical protein
VYQDLPQKRAEEVLHKMEVKLNMQLRTHLFYLAQKSMMHGVSFDQARCTELVYAALRTP